MEGALIVILKTDAFKREPTLDDKITIFKAFCYGSSYHLNKHPILVPNDKTQ